MILDGWGYSADVSDSDAIQGSATPVMDELAYHHSWTTLSASGTSVGLPPNVVGNSEIGHLTIGAGRKIEYESTRVEKAAARGELIAHPTLQPVLERLKEEEKALHLLGLCSDGMVHSNIGHFRALLEAARKNGVRKVYLHPFADGRDVASGTAGFYLEQLQSMAEMLQLGTVATFIGRSFTMDRSGFWHLTQAAYEAVKEGQGVKVRDPREAASAALRERLPDEKIAPSVVVDREGKALGSLKDGDAMVFVNFRGDRMRQFVRSFAAEDLEEFDRGSRPSVDVLTLTEYFADPPVPALFHQADASGGLADFMEEHGIRNVRVAESEKFPHVTFFLNGRDSRTRDLEEHVHVQSPANKDYQHTPEMSAAAVTGSVIEAIKCDDESLVIANLANADVVGHTGEYNAVRSAVQMVDQCVGQICKAAWGSGRWVAIVGDHGNAEVMIDPSTGEPHVGHTTNPVPFVLAHPKFSGSLSPGSTLADVPATVAELMGFSSGGGMTSESLISGG